MCKISHWDSLPFLLQYYAWHVCYKKCQNTLIEQSLLVHVYLLDSRKKVMQRPKSSFGQVETSPVSVCSVYIAQMCECVCVLFICVLGVGGANTNCPCLMSEAFVGTYPFICHIICLCLWGRIIVTSAGRSYCRHFITGVVCSTPSVCLCLCVFVCVFVCVCVCVDGWMERDGDIWMDGI